MVEAETGDYEEILESCVLHSTNVRILCFFLVHPSIITSCWGGDSMVYDHGMQHANRCQGIENQTFTLVIFWNIVTNSIMLLLFVF